MEEEGARECTVLVNTWKAPQGINHLSEEIIIWNDLYQLIISDHLVSSWNTVDCIE